MVEAQGKVSEKSRRFEWILSGNPAQCSHGQGSEEKIRKIPRLGNFEYSPENLKL